MGKSDNTMLCNKNAALLAENENPVFWASSSGIKKADSIFRIPSVLAFTITELGNNVVMGFGVWSRLSISVPKSVTPLLIALIT